MAAIDTAVQVARVATGRGGRGPEDPARTWAKLAPFRATIDASDQVLVVAATGGSKSTLVASLTLPVDSLIAIDEKAQLTLPRARVVELPARAPMERAEPGSYLEHVRRAIAWSKAGQDRPSHRIVLRPDVLDVDEYAAHDDIFHAIYDRGHTITWIDEISATGASAFRIMPWLKGISARGRTRGLGLWTCTQAPVGLTPGILRRNARFLILGPLDPEDAAAIHRERVEIATTIPPKTGRFIVYVSGEREPYRLYVPIPPALRGWSAP